MSPLDGESSKVVLQGVQEGRKEGKQWNHGVHLYPLYHSTPLGTRAEEPMLHREQTLARVFPAPSPSAGCPDAGGQLYTCTWQPRHVKSCPIIVTLQTGFRCLVCPTCKTWNEYSSLLASLWERSQHSSRSEPHLGTCSY